MFTYLHLGAGVLQRAEHYTCRCIVVQSEYLSCVCVLVGACEMLNLVLKTFAI